MSTISEISSAKAGAASQIAIATTVPVSSGGFFVGAYVVAATTDSNGFLKVIAWNIGEPSSGLVRIGDATSTVSKHNVAIVGLDQNRVVTAHVDDTGALNVGVWVVGEIEFPGGGGPPADPIVWLQASAKGGSATQVSIAALSSTEVVTAVRDGSGNLRIDAWTITPGVAPSGDSFGTISPNGSLGSTGVTDVAIAAGTSTQAVAAFRNAGGENDGKLGLILCQLSGGKVTLQNTQIGGLVSQVAIATATRAATLITATVSAEGTLEFSLWSVSLSELYFYGSNPGSTASQIAFCSVKAGSDNIFVAPVLGSSGNLEMQVWDQEMGVLDQSHSGVYTQPTSLLISAVAAATQGYDDRGNGYFATATRGSKPEDLEVRVWSIVAAAARPSKLGSFANYIFGDKNCAILKDIRVTIEVTEAIVTNEVPGFQSNFSIQLNANSLAQPQSASPNIWTVWQQYSFEVKDGIHGLINNWTQPSLKLKNPPINYPTATLVRLPTPNQIPKGYRLTIILETENGGAANGAVNRVRLEVYDGAKTHSLDLLLTSIPDVTAAQLAPIVAFELDVVGPFNKEKTKFKSGAGTITYSASTRFAPQSFIPPCAAASSTTTAESSNSVYGILPAAQGTKFVQSFRL